VLAGPAEVYAAGANQLRIEIRGNGEVVTFAFNENGPASEVRVGPITFRRR
jgi:hypothetical protein